MAYDPINDEKKPFTLREWAEELKAAIDEYVRTFDNANDFHRQPHTWREWLSSFIRFMSW